jgi:hypothetical protein
VNCYINLNFMLQHIFHFVGIFCEHKILHDLQASFSYLECETFPHEQFSKEIEKLLPSTPSPPVIITFISMGNFFQILELLCTVPTRKDVFHKCCMTK